MNSIDIDGVEVGGNSPPYLVAELSANHAGSLKIAIESITQAKACGASAVKLQSYTADSLTLNSSKPDFKIKEGVWSGQTLYELYTDAQMPMEWHEILFEHARDIGITCFSSPFDERSVDMLESLGAPAYKIASFELLDLPLIQYVANTGKPIIISTGMASKREVIEALEVVRSTGNKKIILLHCISAYPAKNSSMNVRMIRRLSGDFSVLVGLSDHSIGNTASQAAVAFGACFIEKHFTLDRSLGGPDSLFSVEPEEFSFLSKELINTWQCLGGRSYVAHESEKVNLQFRRSIYAVNDIPKGSIVKKSDLRIVRPGYGLKPKYLPDLIGLKVNKDIVFAEAISWDMFETVNHSV